MNELEYGDMLNIKSFRERERYTVKANWQCSTELDMRHTWIESLMFKGGESRTG